MQKKGLSDVVVTVLIILLVLAAVVLVWNVIKIVLSDSGEQLEANTLSFGASAITVQSKSVWINSSNQSISLVVRRETEQGNMVGYEIVLEDARGNSRTFRYNESLSQYQTSYIYIHNFSASGLGSNISRILAVPIYISDSGREIRGNAGGITTGPVANANSGNSGAGPTPGTVCPNGIIESGEDCEGANLNGQDCTTIPGGFTGGNLACGATCRFDTSQCSSPPTVLCGNNIAEGAEECDGSDLRGKDCTMVGGGYGGGALSCNSAPQCTFNTTLCTLPAGWCANGLQSACELTRGVCMGKNKTCTSNSWPVCGTVQYGANYQAGSESTCDYLDNDCDGSVDEGIATNVKWFNDSDEDGMGNPLVNVSICAGNPPNGYVANSNDCDDANPSINNGATEIYLNNINENCNASDDNYMQNGIVAYWKFDENTPYSGITGEVKDYRNINPGTARNGAVQEAIGSQKSLKLDGVDDYVQVTNEQNFDFEKSSAFSGCAWVKITQFATPFGTILAKMGGPDSYTGWELSLTDSEVDGDGLSLLISSNFGAGNHMSLYALDASYNNLNKWEHVCFTYDGSSTPEGMKLYMDGAELSTTASGASILTGSIQNNMNLIIGSRTGSTLNHKGNLDNVLVYNRALNPSEITNLYNNQKVFFPN